MDKGLATGGGSGAIGGGDDGCVSVEVSIGVGVGNFLRLEGAVLDAGEVLGFVLECAMMIDADELVGHNGAGCGGVVVDFGLVPGAFEGEAHALVIGGIGRLVL